MEPILHLYIPSAMPVFASCIDFQSPFFSVGGTFVLNFFVEISVSILHLLFAALPLFLGPCLPDPPFIHRGDHVHC